MRSNVYCIILGGGRGDRLYPLTKTRCKPAVPLAGKYRLIDIPISNCLNSGLSKIYILTQFNTRSLHRHIEKTYRFDTFGNSTIEIFSAEQTNSQGEQWYMGTAMP
jgi:glucose-1-phosphate adenylyltransferase